MRGLSLLWIEVTDLVSVQSGVAELERVRDSGVEDKLRRDGGHVGGGRAKSKFQFAIK